MGGEAHAAIEGLPFGGPPYERRSNWRHNMTPFRLAAEIGDLLPNVDPADVASWQCVLVDLAAAIPEPIRSTRWARDSMVGAPTYRLDLTWEYDDIAGDWYLCEQGSRLWGPFSDLGPDRAESLVRARIQLRSDD